jgi:hypothetical protein
MLPWHDDNYLLSKELLRLLEGRVVSLVGASVRRALDRLITQD